MSVVVKSPSRRLVIVGQGAIGSLLAAKACMQQRQLGVLTRTGQTMPMHYQHLANGQTFDFTPEPSGPLGADDVLILPLKAFQIEAALAQQEIPPQTTLVLMHNGMGSIETTRMQYPTNPILAATTSYGVYKPNGRTLIETGQGKTDIGWVQQPNVDVQQLLLAFFESALAPVNWHANIHLALWQKLAVNAVINPLTALHQIKNGALAANEFAEQITLICQEVAAVMRGLGMHCQAADIEVTVRQVIVNTADNFSSMNRDIAAGRVSEIDYINGYVVQQAQSLDIATPINLQLWQQVRAQHQ